MSVSVQSEATQSPHATDKPFRLGIDVGGTFTDLVLLDDRTGRIAVAKTLTTPEDPAVGVRHGVIEILRRNDVDASRIAQVIHATTLIGNAVIEHKGRRTALVVTKGFRDILTLRREGRYDNYDSNLQFPRLLVQRRDTVEVLERISSAGDVRTPLADDAAQAAVEWVKRGRYAAVAICLLHAYRNSVHEKKLEEAFARLAPEIAVSRSSAVLPLAGEYERACAVAINALVQPITINYLDEVVSDLIAAGIRCPLYCMGSYGGLLTSDTAKSHPIRLLESGPVAGALGAAFLGRAALHTDALAFDMGGTTAKACIIRGGAPTETTDFEVARVRRLTKGSGLPVRLPTVDVLEVGSGGGSIARADKLGLINVGPDSAGPDPGPASYGRGSELPTVTDANLLLGYLDPNFFLGGEMKLDFAAAELAVGRLGAQINLTRDEAAWAIHEIVSQNMANTLRTHAIEKGVDFRDFALIASGGAGPTHAYRIAELLRIRTVVYPWKAGVFSAFGLLTAPLRFDAFRALPTRLDQLQVAQAQAIFEGMERELVELLSQAGLQPRQITFRRTADMRYVGQALELEVQIANESPEPSAFALGFSKAYADRYGWTLKAPIEVVTWRCSAKGPQPVITARTQTPRDVGRSEKGERPVFVSERAGFLNCPVYDRERLAPNSVMNGPAIVEEHECTIFIGPKATGSVDAARNIVMALAVD